MFFTWITFWFGKISSSYLEEFILEKLKFSYRLQNNVSTLFQTRTFVILVTYEHNQLSRSPFLTVKIFKVINFHSLPVNGTDANRAS